MIHRPRLVFRVGVTGHRPDRLAHAGADEALLCAQIRTALQVVVTTVRTVHLSRAAPYADSDPILRIVSALAEGADRLAVRVALEMMFELDAPLPFASEVYKRDFVSQPQEPARDTRTEFRQLVSGARRVLELDSDPESDHAYVAVGTTTVRQCDLLLAIWDGAPARGPGGAPDNVAEALRMELPTIWIDARGSEEHAMGLAAVQDGKIVRQPWSSHDVAARIERLISLPSSPQPLPSRGHDGRTPPLRCVEDFFHENPSDEPPRSFFGTANRFFAKDWELDPEYRQLRHRSDVLSPLPEADRVRLEPGDDALAHTLADDVPAAEWTTDFRSLIAALGALLTPSFHDADRLAIRYANLHRDYMAKGFLVYAPLAVLCAFLSFALRDVTVASVGFGVAEVVLIGAIWLGHRNNLRSRYHQRWLDYRSIAEKLRHVLILAPLGRPSLDVQLPMTVGTSEPSTDWTNWYLRARIREEGLMSGGLHDPQYAAALRTLLWRGLVRGQIRYHARTAARMRQALRRVEAWRDFFFVAAGAAAATHVAVAGLGAWHESIGVWEQQHVWLTMTLSAATVFFPSVVAALHGYSQQADFENTEMRSQSELARLLQVDGELRARANPSSLDLLRFTSLTSESMLAELALWRDDTASRPAAKP
jgi:hypothetical protein